MSSDPFAPPESDVTGPSSEPLDRSDVLFTVTPEKHAKWGADFHEAHVEFIRTEDGHRFAVKRDDFPDVGLLSFLGGNVGVNVKKPERAIVIIPNHLRAEIRAWLDPVLAELIRRPARKHLPRKILFGLFCGVMFLLDQTTFWILLFLWNLVSIAMGFVKPSRWVFVGSAVYSLAICGYFVYWAVTNGTWWMLALVGLILFGAYASMQKFKFYGEG